MAGSIDKAKTALDDIVDQLDGIERSVAIPPSTRALVRATRDLARAVKMLLDKAEPTNDR